MTNAERAKIQDEIVDGIINDPHGIVLLSPRIGKTRIGIEVIKRRKAASVLWVTSEVKLRDIDIPADFKKFQALSLLHFTDIICYGTLNNIPDLTCYDLIILDEVQHLTEGNSGGLYNILDTTPILGMTGKMPKHEEKLKIYADLELDILKEVNIDDAVDMGLVADYKIIVHQIAPDNIEKNIEAGSPKKRFLQSEHAQLAYLDRAIMRASYTDEKKKGYLIRNRMHQIYRSPTKFKLAQKLREEYEGRKLFFCGSIAQADAMCEHTFHSKTSGEAMDAFKKGAIDEISCVNAGGTGHTYENVQHFFIVQANSNRRGDVTQKIARALLLQEDYVGCVHILCLTGTQDEKWVASALEDFDQSKITYKRY